MDALEGLVGREVPLDDIARELKFLVSGLAPTAVGACHVTCSDEAAHESASAFRRAFAKELLPRLKTGLHAPLRTANLGGRYEEGSARIAEAHFATPESRDGFKVIVVKVDGHVGVASDGAFGFLDRYGRRSKCCGALHATLHGSGLPFATELGTTLGPRLDTLREMDPEVAPLFAAICSAALQAQHAVKDIRARPPVAPTRFVVVHGVTINRPGPDTAILGGVHVVERTRDEATLRSFGLGDDPASFRLARSDAGLSVASSRC